jgi:hypothetical protein
MDIIKKIVTSADNLMLFGIANIVFFSYRYVWTGTALTDSQGSILFLVTMFIVAVYATSKVDSIA